jgi:hypothetical protein
MMLTNTKSKVLTWSLLPVVLVVVGVAAFLLARSWSAAPSAPAVNTTPTNPAIEAQWGIRITQIGVTADGGLVDFRYLVIDPDKALAMLQGEKSLPTLTAEDSRILVNSAAMMAPKHELAAGRTYFLLYRNTKGAIKRGTPVTVQIGDLQLEHVVAK